jgi:inorganic pyrophosphatase
MLEMVDSGQKDEKILSVANNNPRFAEIRDYSGVWPHMLLEISHFFATYKDLEGKRAIVSGWRDAKHACNVIKESHERFMQNAAKSQGA